MTTRDGVARENDSMKGTVVVAETETKGLVATAREAVEDKDGDREAAVSLLVDWIKDDPHLIEEAIQWAAREAVKTVRTHNRQILTRPLVERVQGEFVTGNNGASPKPTPPPSRQQSSVAGLRVVSDFVASKWFGWDVPYAGKVLGESKTGDLDLSVRKLRTSVATGTWQILFLESVRERLPETKTVRQVLTESEIENLMVAAQRAVYSKQAS